MPEAPPRTAERDIRVLLVADADGDDEIRDLLRAPDVTGAELFLAGTIDEAGSILSTNDGIDAVVMDGAGRSDPIADVGRLRDAAPGLPLVVLAGARDVGVGAVAAGAQDVLVREDLDLAVLVRSLRFAVERQRLAGGGSRRNGQLHDTGEIEALERISGRDPTTVSRRDPRLSEVAPDDFEELVERYGELLRLAAERESYRDGPDLDESVRALASYLGVARAHPRDAVEMHLRAVRGVADTSEGTGLGTYLSGGRVLLIELLGQLAAYYRVYAWGPIPGARSAERDAATR